jgi:hypothetical protein
MLSGIFAVSACASIESRSVGAPQFGKEVGGIPIVVERPRFLKRSVVAVTFITFVKTVAIGPSEKVQTEWKTVATNTVTELRDEIITVGELYTLDLKRPMAGTMDYQIDFRDTGHYPKTIKGKVEDKTIEAASKAVGEILEKVAKPTAAKVEEGLPERVRISEDMTSVTYYDLASGAQLYKWQKGQPAP